MSPDAPAPEFTIPLDSLEDEEIEAAYRSPRPKRRSAAFDSPTSSEQQANLSHAPSSVEQPRRAVSEQIGSRLSRGSFGSIRFSDLGEDDVDDSGMRVMGGGEDFGRLSFGEVDIGALRDELEDVESVEEYVDPACRRSSQEPPLTSNSYDAPQPERQDASVRRSDPSMLLLADDDGAPVAVPDLVSSSPIPEPRHAEPVEASSREAKRSESKAKKTLKLSRHGLPYPSLPVGVVKKLASNFARSGAGAGRGSKTTLGKDAMAAIMQATEWFFGAYAAHGGRKTIDESDVLTLMKRYFILTVYVHRHLLVRDELI
jgi:hypothetical protein